MTHEPECNLQLKDEHGRPAFPPFPYVCNCEAIREAYQRGRKDAAKAVFALDDENKSFRDHETWIRYHLGRFDMRHDAYLAALHGDGEQS